MSKKLALITLLLCLGLNYALALDTLAVYEDSLANGLKILVLEKHDLPIASFQVWYRVGSRNERPGITGISHLLEHMMFKASGKIGPEDFTRIIQKYGGHANGSTSKDYTFYYENIAVEFLPQMMELEAGRMHDLKLDSLEFESERQVVMEERRLRENSPWGRLVEETEAAAFMAHPYGIPTLGWMSDLKAMTLDDLRSYYDTYYAPNNATCVIVGDIKPGAAVQQVQKYFGDIPRGAKPPPGVRTVEPEQRGERRVTVQRQAQTPLLIIAYHGCTSGSYDEVVLDLLLGILSEGQSSRFYQSLVYQQKVALYAESYNDARRDPGLFMLYAAPIAGRSTLELEQSLYAELEKVKKEGVTAGELEKARNQKRAGYIFSRQGNAGLGEQLGSAATRHGWHDVNKYLKDLEKVTPEDIKQAAQKYLTADNRTVATLVPQAVKGQEK
ncbi:insulinase family protein [candidate division TA06 bacterium]|uniref:Insulinase family protein n=1 Tax=candidate division TA06 bacterium TaxID=2250710 RepID=A0A933IDL9_UNCT6|nr:insulinase family protein [candidate division TA06 bacterium]